MKTHRAARRQLLSGVSKRAIGVASLEAARISTYRAIENFAQQRIDQAISIAESIAKEAVA